MDELARLTIRVDERDATRATRSLDALTASTAKAERGAAALASGAGRMALGLSAVGAAAVATLRPIIDAGDQYTKLANKLAATAGGPGGMLQTQAQLFALAQQTGQSFDSIVSSFARASLSAKALNASQADMVTLTGAVAKSMQVSGASAGEAASASQQLAQALSSGVLAGDELKAILENAPVLAQQIAAGLGVGVGELRKMGAEGRLLSTDVFGAILKQSGEIDAQFARMSGTVDASLTRVGDAFDRLLAGIDKRFSASGRFATFLDLVSGTLTMGAGTTASAFFGANANAAEGASDSVAGRLRAARDREAARAAETQRFAAAAAGNPLFGTGGGIGGPGFGQQGTAFRFSGLFADPTTNPLEPIASAVTATTTKTAAAITTAATNTQRMLDDLSAAGQELVRGIQRRFDETALLLDTFAQSPLNSGLRRSAVTGVTVGRSASDLIATDRAPSIAAQDRAEASLAESLRRGQALTQALADGLQRSIAQGIAGGFTDGTKSLEAFGKNLKQTLLNAVSEGLANKLVGSLMGNGKDGGLSGLLGGLLGGGGKTAGIAKGGALSGLGGLGLFGLGVAGVASLLKPDTERRTRGTKWQSGPLSASPFTPTASAPDEIPRMISNAPPGFNDGAYRFGASGSGAGSRVAAGGVTIGSVTITLPTGTPREHAEAILREFNQMGSAQGRAYGSMPLGRT
jgi:tape measure domain-containing protein